jgi:hypothetical protein
MYHRWFFAATEHDVILEHDALMICVMSDCDATLLLDVIEALERVQLSTFNAAQTARG